MTTRPSRLLPARVFRSDELVKTDQIVGRSEFAGSRLINMKSKQEELTQKTGRSCEREWYEKVLDAGSTFAGNITGYYDYKKATEGVNPVTGEKLEPSD